MTFKSFSPKSLFKWAAALLVLGILVVVVQIAWGMGVRWPTVHRVDQPGVPDSIYVKAVDFLDDSGYVVEVSFRTCCTDNLICKRSGAGYTSKKIQIQLRPNDAIASIPLQWQEKSMCPYQFQSARLAVWGKAENISYSFSEDSSLPTVPRRLNGTCLTYRHPSIGFGTQGDERPPDSCLRNTHYRFSAEEDTVLIVGATR